MTFNDGIVALYTVTNIAEPGMKPKKGLKKQAFFYYGFEVLGFNRYYTALKANQQIEAVIHIPECNDIDPALTVAVLENGKQYRIVLIQPTVNDDGLRFTRLSLERISEEYDYIGNNQS